MEDKIGRNHIGKHRDLEDLEDLERNTFNKTSIFTNIWEGTINGAYPKWLVYFRENPHLEMDDDWGYPHGLETTT